MRKNSKADVNLETATIAGYWVGVVALVLSILGFAFTLYTTYRGNPDASLIALSGWGAAILLGIVSGFIGSKLVAAVLLMQTNVHSLHEDISDLRIAHAQEQDRANQAIAVSEFIASRAVRAPTKPRQRKTDQQEQER